jgi:S-(hydroxymethyl)glutathione dehydrogenase/alcohol dehydrogenase
MKAAVLYEAKKPLVVEEVDLDPPGPGEVKVRLAAAAICHSDIHMLMGDLPSKLPGIAGHECSGYIDEIGPGVTSVKPGDHVVMAPVTGGCGHCVNCMLGYRNLCQNNPPRPPHHHTKKGEPIATLAGPVGGFVEYTVVGEYQCAKIPDDMPMDRAALLGCAVITGFGAVINRAQVKPFQSVAVFGIGGVGVNTVQGAIFSGAHPVIAIDILDSKLEIAKNFGATHTLNSKKVDDPIQAIKDMTYGRGVDYSFIMTPSIDAVRQGSLVLGPRGMEIIVGIARGDLSKFMATEFISEKMLTGSMMGSTRLQLDVARYAEIYKAGRLKLDESITGRYPLEKINDAVASSMAGEALRNVIVFE